MPGLPEGGVVILQIVGIVLILAVIAFAALSAYLASYAVHGARYTLQQSWDFDTQPGKEGLKVRSLENYPTKSYEIQSFDGYTLHAQLYPNEKPSDHYVILTHGYTVNRNASLKYVVMFLEMGYNCVIYDDRGHGENAPAICTYSLTESKDLMAVIADTYQRYGKDIYLGLHGESLGSATQIRALENHPDVRFLVNDCGFAEIVPVMQGGLKGMHLPAWMIYPASLACRVLYGYAFTAARPIDSLAENQVPICFIHGAADDFITPDHSERMQKATKGYSELHLFPGAAHALSIASDPIHYREVVAAFLRKIDDSDIEGRV